VNSVRDKCEILALSRSSHGHEGFLKMLGLDVQHRRMSQGKSCHIVSPFEDLWLDVNGEAI
jgi:hypothetical protein